MHRSFGVFNGITSSFNKNVHGIILVLIAHDDRGNEPIVSSIGSPLSPPVELGYVFSLMRMYSWVLAKGIDPIWPLGLWSLVGGEVNSLAGICWLVLARCCGISAKKSYIRKKMVFQSDNVKVKK